MKTLKDYLAMFAIAFILQGIAIFASFNSINGYMIPCFVYASGLAIAIVSKMNDKIDKEKK